MKPLFTIHAGEFVVGDFIEGKFSGVNLWVPTRDTGIDLLATDSRNQKTVSLQVKFSRDYSARHIFQKRLKACSWCALNRQKLVASKADYWVFVLMGFDRNMDFVIIKPSDLLAKFDSIHGKAKTIQSYLWVTETKHCWEARGLNRHDQTRIAQDEYTNDVRDFSRFLNDWNPIKALSVSS